MVIAALKYPGFFQNQEFGIGGERGGKRGQGDRMDIHILLSSGLLSNVLQQLGKTEVQNNYLKRVSQAVSCLW